MYDTLFLDRDGVLNRKIDSSYVLSVKDIEILPGITEFLSYAKQAFSRILVVTNQRCIGRGILTMPDLQEINNEINKRTGGYIDQFFICPHLDEDNCSCRKPKIGLFLNAAQAYDIDFHKSWMIGDSETDLIPAKNLGIKTIFISTTISRFADRTINSNLDLRDIFHYNYSSFPNL